MLFCLRLMLLLFRQRREFVKNYMKYAKIGAQFLSIKEALKNPIFRNLKFFWRLLLLNIHFNN